MPSDQSLVLRQHFPLPCDYIAPRSPSERRIAEIWRTILGMDCVGIEDDYNDLGGDSFMATLIFSEIKAEFGVALSLATLANASTVERLARAVDSACAATTSSLGA